MLHITFVPVMWYTCITLLRVFVSHYISISSTKSNISRHHLSIDRTRSKIFSKYDNIIFHYDHFIWKDKIQNFFNIQFRKNYCLNSKALLNDQLTLTDFNTCWKQWFQDENKQKKPYKKIALLNSFVITDNTQMQKVKVCITSCFREFVILSFYSKFNP